MKSVSFTLLLLLVAQVSCSLLTAQGFPSNYTQWSMPIGGFRDNGAHYGYDNVFGFTSTAYDNGSESWTVVDMNGDNLPDVVVTAETASSAVKSFSPAANAYWKVYLNNGSGFPSTYAQWTMPIGGYKDNGAHYGYINIGGTALQTDDTGSESWSLVDIDGDGKPDLVVTAQVQSSAVRSFSPGSNPYWKVYLNNGSGFATSATNWPMPIGGFRDNGSHYGYVGVSGTALQTDDNTSQTWNLVDMNGDEKPDLVVTAELASSAVRSFSPGSNPYWKVFLNSGSGFATTYSSWTMPIGGFRDNGAHYGYVNIGGTALQTDDNTSQSWSLADMNGDGNIDLVVTAELASSAVRSFSPSANAYWKVYLSTGSGFPASHTSWSMPIGGRRDNGAHYGYVGTSGFALTTDDANSESWTLIDLNHDARPDLVVTAQVQSSAVKSFSPSSNPYWKAFMNNGAGFPVSNSTWTVPVGGLRDNGAHYGYIHTVGVALITDDNTSETWTVMDMNGDEQPDMVVTAQNQSSAVKSFSPSSNPYWKVFISPFIVGVDGGELESGVVLSPNPATEKLSIRVGGFEVGQAFQVVDLQGRRLMAGQLQGETTLLDVHGLADGVYFLVIDGEKRSVVKFVKE